MDCSIELINQREELTDESKIKAALKLKSKSVFIAFTIAIVSETANAKIDVIIFLFMIIFLVTLNGRGYEQLGTTWAPSFQPCRKLASESEARTTA